MVTDEGTTIQGHDSIRQWRRETAPSYNYTVEVLSAENTSGDNYLVTAKLEGTFPGSPVQLNCGFPLHDYLISELRIAP